MPEGVRKKLAAQLQLREGGSLLAVHAIEGRRALEQLLAASDMSHPLRCAVMRWAKAEQQKLRVAALGAACDHAEVMPLRVALFPGAHREAAARMLTRACAALPEQAAETRAAYQRFLDDAGDDVTPAPLLLGDPEMELVRERFGAHPILGLLWAAAQTMDWAAGSRAWRHVARAGLHADVELRHAEVLPRGPGRRSDAKEGGPQIGVGQKVSYPRALARWCAGAVVAFYGCAECSVFDDMMKLGPRHILLFGACRPAPALALAPHSTRSLTTCLPTCSPTCSRAPQTSTAPRSRHVARCCSATPTGFAPAWSQCRLKGGPPSNSWPLLGSAARVT